MSEKTQGHNLFIGIAGWSVGKAYAERFPENGSHLERYAQRFNCVEINSSFYRPHRSTTYVRWAESVPAHFRFAVKVPKEITHIRRFVDTDELLDRFLSEATALGQKLGPLLVQLPPSFRFEQKLVQNFFKQLRKRHNGQIACEPRHLSWFNDQADACLTSFEVARVAADPAILPAAAEPGGWTGLVYYRLHGSPKIYYSSYSDEYLATLKNTLLKQAENHKPVWCIFDNTTLGAATKNSLDLLK